MEKPIYPLKNMRITQGYNQGTHVDSYAIDDAGKDSGIEEVFAPFTGTIRKIYPKDANEVWLESDNPVEYPDGTIDYLTILFAHNNDVSNLYVGKQIKQGQAFYKEGTSGNATGNHCHLECGKGKYQEPGWAKNKAGYYGIINAKRPEECLWIEENTNVINSNNYQFKTIKKEVETPIEELTPTPEIEKPIIEESPVIEQQPAPEITNPSLLYTCTKDGLYGIYLKKGNQVYLK